MHMYSQPFSIIHHENKHQLLNLQQYFLSCIQKQVPMLHLSYCFYKGIEEDLHKLLP